MFILNAILICSFLTTILFVAYGIYYIGKRNAKKAALEYAYEIRYKHVNAIIDSWEVSEKSYKVIYKMLYDLEEIYHNEEKTAVIWQKFLIKYVEFDDPGYY